MGLMSKDARERRAAKRTTKCPFCGALPGEKCFDMRPWKRRRTVSIRPGRWRVWRAAQTPKEER